jgi:hypothetical protein
MDTQTKKDLEERRRRALIRTKRLIRELAEKYLPSNHQMILLDQAKFQVCRHFAGSDIWRWLVDPVKWGRSSETIITGRPVEIMSYPSSPDEPSTVLTVPPGWAADRMASALMLCAIIEYAQTTSISYSHAYPCRLVDWSDLQTLSAPLADRGRHVAELHAPWMLVISGVHDHFGSQYERTTAANVLDAVISWRRSHDCHTVITAPDLETISRLGIQAAGLVKNCPPHANVYPDLGLTTWIDLDDHHPGLPEDPKIQHSNQVGQTTEKE